MGWGGVTWGGVVWAGYNQPSFLFHLRSRGMQCAFCFGSPWMDRCVFQVLTNWTTHFRSYLSSNSWTLSLYENMYFQGHPVDGSWVFGMFERGSTKCCLAVVERRDAATLIPLILKNILPGI